MNARKIVSAEIYVACTCGSNEWKIVRVVDLNLPDTTQIGKLPLTAKCARCGAIAGWLTISDMSGQVN